LYVGIPSSSARSLGLVSLTAVLLMTTTGFNTAHLMRIRLACVQLRTRLRSGGPERGRPRHTHISGITV
jgi:hypothetical protein